MKKDKTLNLKNNNNENCLMIAARYSSRYTYDLLSLFSHLPIPQQEKLLCEINHNKMNALMIAFANNHRTLSGFYSILKNCSEPTIATILLQEILNKRI